MSLLPRQIKECGCSIYCFCVHGPPHEPYTVFDLLDTEIEKLEEQAKAEEVLRRMEMGLGIQ